MRTSLNYNYNQSKPFHIGLPKICKVFNPPTYDKLLNETLDTIDGPIRHRCRDIYFLLNQKRISKELQPAFEELVSSMRSNNTLSRYFSKMSDSEIISTIKSRYCQNLSEMADWRSYLEFCLSNEKQPVTDKSETNVSSSESSDSSSSDSSSSD